MALPTRAELEERINAGSIRTSRPNKRLIERQNEVSEKEASRSTLSRFFEELGVNAYKVPIDIAQGTARSIASLPLAGIKGKEATIAPNSKFSQAVFGTDKPFNLQSEGGDFLQMFGASEDTISKYGFATGLTLGLLDFIPGGKNASTIGRVSKSVAKTNDTQTIAKNLRVVLDGDEDAIQNLARTLKDVNDPREAQKLISEAGATTRGSSITELADTIRASGVDRQKFLDDIKAAVSDPNTRSGQRALNLTTKLRQRGLTPEAFYDGLVSRAPLKSSAPADRAARATLNIRETPVRTTESRLLKNRIKDMSSGARAGSVSARAEVKAIQTQLTKQITDNLPVAYRGALIKKIKNANSPATLRRALEGVNKKIRTYNEALQLRKELSSRRSKLAFINKLNELNSTAVRDMKNQLGIKKHLRHMDKEELDQMISEARKRFEFKKERGLTAPKTKDAKGNIVERKGKRKMTVDENKIDSIREARKVNNTYKKKLNKKITNAKSTAQKIGDLVSIPSEALRAIGAGEVLTGLRRMGFNSRKYTKEANEITSTIIKKLGIDSKTPKISPDDLLRLDVAMKDGAVNTVMEIAEKHRVKNEFIQLRKVLDEMFMRANEVGLDVKYRSGFFPRSFKDDAATRKAATEYFEKEAGDLLDEAYKNFETKMGRAPFEEERWKMINNLMRGFKQEGVTLSKTGSLKRRVLEEITAETDDFYENSFVALANYFESANNLIEARRFFGKHLPYDIKKLPAEAKLDDVVGVIFDKLVKENKINPANSERLREILTARFTGGKGWIQDWKNISYLTIMGDVLSAVTQIGDFEKVMYRAGVRKAFPAIFKSIFNPSSQQVRLADLGLDKTIAEEMANPSKLGKMVNQVFKLSGLSSIDRLGKEAFINGTLSRYKKAIKNSDEKYLANARRLLGKESEQTFADIAAGRQTENVRFLALNELADFFPVTLEEVPIQYLKSPNGRIFYTMKTFTTKQLNNYRREIIDEYNSGNKVQASKNMARLVGMFVVMNMTADEIKDFIKGEEEPLRDKVVDNFLKTIGFSKYNLDRSQQAGAGRAVLEATLLPPTTFVDDAVKDFNDVFVKGKDDPLRTTRNIPLGGELYYWWFGRGAQKREEEQAKERKKTSSSRARTRTSNRTTER